MDIVDPELTSYDATEVMRFIKVALFCTQAVVHHRPTMKQVVQMLSKEVQLNDMALTEPGVHRWRRASSNAANSSDETSASQAMESKKPDNSHMTSNQFGDSDIVTDMLPR